VSEMDIHEVLRYLPHRFPFLLIDRVRECEPGKRIVAVKNVTANEPHFQGHFPDRPIMPGVLILEAMAQAAASLVARHLPNAEVIDYADASKPDAPSGTSREVAERLAEAGVASIEVPGDADGTVLAARGTAVGPIRIHSLRLPGYSVSTEVVFGLPDERLTIRHDAGMSAEPYVAGTLLAIRHVVGRVGLTRGLDSLLVE